MMSESKKLSTASKPKTQSEKSRWRTMVALAFGYFVDQGEAQAMSVLFPTLRALWGLSFADLGLVGTIRNLLQSISAPFWGYISDRYPRKNVIVFGTGVWGIWTLLVGFTQNFGQLLWIRAISGIGLGCLMPATFSLMSDTFPPEKRGRALGLMEGIGTMGIVVSVVGLGFLASPDLWRWGFIVLGVFSVLSGVVIWFMVDEPVRGAAEPELEGVITEEKASQYKMKAKDMIEVLKIPTIWVAIAQGLTGSMPWVVMGLFFITWVVETLGVSEEQAGLAFAGIVVGVGISNVMGGFLGDWAETKSPKYGRTVIGQISVFSGVPLTWLLFTKTTEWPFWAIVALCFGTALFIGWAGKGAKEPMMQGAVPPELRSTAFAMTTFIESGFAALVAIFAGTLADRIGLTKAMVWTVPVPWIACGLLYSLFYWAYPRDSKILRAQMAQRAEEIR
jgi:MFS family permease